MNENKRKNTDMFRRLRIQMTGFSTAITSTILIVMALACLFLSESALKETAFTSFSNNAHSCISYLESQSTLSHKWLIQAKGTYGIDIELKDNGNPLFFNKLQPTPKTQQAFGDAAGISRDAYHVDTEYPSKLSTLTRSALFQMEGYYACTAVIPKEHGVLSAVILYPLDALRARIQRQRLFYALIVLAAVLALSVFSWFFTEKMIKPLKESRKRQTEFIASASHELRSPLAVILSSVQAMEDCQENLGRFLPSIRNEGQRMARLINDMLSLANADNQSWSIHPSFCELDTLLLDTYEKYEPAMEKKQLQFSIVLPEEPVAKCLCDSSRISQVLGILIDNALTYVPEKGRLCLTLSQDGKYFFLIVSDNGPGIPKEQRESVFQRFYRADSSRNDKQHFGLGLCIAKEIVNLHHGFIRVTETPGGGATFTIALPRKNTL